MVGTEDGKTHNSTLAHTPCCIVSYIIPFYIDFILLVFESLDLLPLPYASCVILSQLLKRPLLNQFFIRKLEKCYLFSIYNNNKIFNELL